MQRKRNAESSDGNDRPTKVPKTQDPTKSAASQIPDFKSGASRDADNGDKIQVHEVPEVPEDLALAQLIETHLLTFESSAYLFTHGRDPATLRGNIREFVRSQLSREPMATFVRMCLVSGEPAAPDDPEALARIGEISQDDFDELFNQIDHSNIFPDTPFERNVPYLCGAYAAAQLQAMFLRGARLVCERLPLGWSRRVNVDELMLHLSCNDLMRVLPSSREEEAVHPPGTYAVSIAYWRGDVGEWLEPGNEESARKFADMIESGFRHSYITHDPPNADDIESMACDFPDDFEALVRASPMFAQAIGSLAPIECFRQGLANCFHDPAVAADICAILERDVRAARDLYMSAFESLVPLPLFSEAWDTMAGLVVQYCI